MSAPEHTLVRLVASPLARAPNCAAYTVGEPPVVLSRPDVAPAGRRFYRERELCGTYVRRLVRSAFYQVRFWCPLPADAPYYRRFAPTRPGGAGLSVNAGVYRSRRDAHDALVLIARAVRGDRPIDVWRAVHALQRAEAIPTGSRGYILPLWVRRHGGAYVGVLRRRGAEPVRTKPLPTPESAHMTLWYAVTARA